MDDDPVIERMRSGAARLGTDETDVGSLVRGAVQRGRRRRARRRAVGAGLTGLVAAGLVVVAVSTGLPSVQRGGPVGVPVGPPSTAPTSVSSPSPTPSPSRTPTGRVSGRPADVQRVLTGLLPGSLRVSRATSSRDEGSNGFPWENSAAMTVTDAKGSTQVLGGIGNGTYDDACFGYQKCERSTLPDGSTLWTSTSTGGDKSGTDRNWYLDRPDGGHVWLTERNYAEGNGPVTRQSLLISWATGTDIVTDPAWDALFTG